MIVSESDIEFTFGEQYGNSAVRAANDGAGGSADFRRDGGICLTMKDAAHVVVSQSEARMADSTAGWKVIGQGANALAASGDADMKRLAEEIRFAAPMPTSIDGEIAAQVFYDSTAIT